MFAGNNIRRVYWTSLSRGTSHTACRSSYRNDRRVRVIDMTSQLGEDEDFKTILDWAQKYKRYLIGIFLNAIDKHDGHQTACSCKC